MDVITVLVLNCFQFVLELETMKPWTWGYDCRRELAELWKERRVRVYVRHVCLCEREKERGGGGKGLC